jgi:predicted hydrocarbon binding protein
MHGVVYASFRDFVAARFGAETCRTVFEGEPAYLLSEAYPDERLGALVARTCELVGIDPEVAVYEFGVFTGEKTFARLYPAFFSVAHSAQDFLLTVETRIHELVRATVPSARPPQLTVERLGDDGVSILYRSPRQLCTLLRGLAEGTSRRFGETTEIVESTCMKRGDEACRLEVRLRPLSGAA